MLPIYTCAVEGYSCRDTYCLTYLCMILTVMPPSPLDWTALNGCRQGSGGEEEEEEREESTYLEDVKEGEKRKEKATTKIRNMDSGRYTLSFFYRLCFSVSVRCVTTNRACKY
jgi:hypothetical protein